jgi:hypothetical protein
MYRKLWGLQIDKIRKELPCVILNLKHRHTEQGKNIKSCKRITKSPINANPSE